MFAISCGQCGAPTGVSLAADGYACTHCKFAAPFAGEALERLNGARQLLRSDAHRRQLTAAQHKLLRRSALYSLVIVFAILALAISCTACAVPFVYFNAGDTHNAAETALLITFPFGTLACMFLFTWMILRSVRRDRESLEGTCAAIPPEQPGQPSSCRVCGGALEGQRGIVRCGYCETDNVLVARGGAATIAKHATDLDAFEQQLRDAGTALGAESFNRLKAVAMLVVLAPLVGILLSTLVVSAVEKISGQSLGP